MWLILQMAAVPGFVIGIYIGDVIQTGFDTVFLARLDEIGHNITLTVAPGCIANLVFMHLLGPQGKSGAGICDKDRIVSTCGSGGFHPLVGT